MVLGIEQVLDQASYRPMLTTTHWRTDNQDDTRSLQLLLERQVDGVIVLAGRVPDEALRTAAAQLPTVVVTRRIPGLEPQCLYIDNQGGAYRATRYLLGLGHTRIAHIAGPSDHPDAVDRLLGYQPGADRGRPGHR